MAFDPLRNSPITTWKLFCDPENLKPRLLSATKVKKERRERNPAKRRYLASILHLLTFVIMQALQKDMGKKGGKGSAKKKVFYPQRHMYNAK